MDESLSGVQRFFLRIMPAAWGESMRAESMRWRYHCPHCGHVRSVWEMGGIRWKARGNSRTFLRCLQCGQRSWQQLHYEDAPRPRRAA